MARSPCVRVTKDSGSSLARTDDLSRMRENPRGRPVRALMTNYGAILLTPRNFRNPRLGILFFHILYRKGSVTCRHNIVALFLIRWKEHLTSLPRSEETSDLFSQDRTRNLSLALNAQRKFMTGLLSLETRTLGLHTVSSVSSKAFPETQPSQSRTNNVPVYHWRTVTQIL